MSESTDNSFHFVISAPRSGSTWLARALNGHPQIVATENRLFGMFFDIWKNRQGKGSPRMTADQFARGLANHSFFQELGFADAASMQEAFLEQYLSMLAGFLRSQSGKPVVVDKVTPYLGTSHKVVQQIQKYFPDARIIQLIRDGRDVAVSGVFDWVAREQPDSDRYRLFVEGDSGIRLSRFFDDESLEQWSRYWTEPVEASGSSAGLTIRYESMLGDQAAVLGEVFAFLEVDNDPELAAACAGSATFEKMTGRERGQDQPLKKTRKGISGDWQNYFTREDARQFQERTGNWLQQLEYEPDLTWIDQCPDTLDLSVA
ncbi:MAG: sulfotransferase domain-containing protein [Pirellulaceae bacterium]